MIIQSLVSLYNRLSKEEKVPPLGFSVEDIGFSIVINKQGDLVGDPQDLRSSIKANVYEYRQSVVPYSNKVNVRSSGAKNVANFMVDKADYIFGMSGKTKKEVHHKSFTDLIDQVCCDVDEDGVKAVKLFLSKWKAEDAAALKYWDELSGDKGKWIAFELEGERGFIHERPEVQKLWKQYVADQKYEEGLDLASGEKKPIQKQYSQFKFGSGASLVSFNESAYESYNKKRGQNAPISVDAEFESSTALKYLLRSKGQRLKIGDATTVFWTENNSPVEAFLGMILNPQDDDTNQDLQIFLNAIRSGQYSSIPDYDGVVKFYILGLSLNKARLAVRFWYVCKVDDLMNRICEHFKHLEMEKNRDNDPLNPGIWHLLKETARETKDISRLLGGALMRSILEGTHYPLNLFNGVLNRIRVEQAKKDKNSGKSIPNINYLRAAICKAVLTRNYKMEVPMSLDTEKNDIAYLLGRLFAVLEKAQQGAIPGAKVTIKDRFYGSASATPASVFPRLLSLATKHYKKAKFGQYYESIVAEIMEEINSNGFPNHMDLKQQGLFSIAYYQQRNALFKKKDNSEKSEE